MYLCCRDERNSCISLRDLLAPMKFVPLSLKILKCYTCYEGIWSAARQPRRFALLGLWQAWGRCDHADRQTMLIRVLRTLASSFHYQMEGVEWHVRWVNLQIVAGICGSVDESRVKSRVLICEWDYVLQSSRISAKLLRKRRKRHCEGSLDARASG